MKKSIFLFIGLLLLKAVSADIPTGYYNNATGLSGEALTSALHNIIDDHTVKTYGDARYILDESDKDPDNANNLILIYTGGSVSDVWDLGVTWNREHVWSKSHGFPDEGDDIAYSDIHNLKPSHPNVNSSRSEKDFDEGGTPHSIATECFYTTDTWEPRDAVKGDVARIMFYMAVRYEGDATGETDLVLVDNLTTYPNPEFGILSTLLKWHNEDPVDDFERNRNNIIYLYQNNRNPFIDHPEYVAKIWGGEVSNPAPTISSVNNTPGIPSSSEAVSITATIIDDGIITDSKMHWGLISGALINTITLTNTSEDLYTADSDIPAQNDGTTVFYEIEAADDSSNVAISSEYSYTVDNNPPAIILDENFTVCPASGWTSFSVSGSVDWECSTGGYLYVNAYGGDAASDDWFISPSMDLDLYNDEYLTFSSYTYYTDVISPTIELQYSTNYSGAGDPNVATWTNLSPTWSNTNSQIWTESGEVDLSGISGTNVYIAFRYISSGTESGTCAIWEIDDIYITETVNILPEISEINSTPIIPDDGEDVTVSATITDLDGTVTSANIKWGTTSGIYPNSVPMSNSVDSYSGIIPAQAEGAFVYYIIEATDNSSEIRQSQEKVFSFNTAGNGVPSITNIELTPETPSSADGVTVSATITDSDGTVSVALMKWGFNTGKYDYTVELIKSDDIYSGYIPARPEDTTIYYVIYAADNDGGAIQSSETNYIINDPPEISNVDITPDAPADGDNVIVSASVTDNNSSVASVVLKWKTSTGTYTDVNMNFSSNLYTGVIPKQAAGESISFSIEATDNLGAASSYTFGYYDVSGANGVINIDERRILIYPNPASNELNINVENYKGDVEIQVYNIIGSLVYTEKLNISNSHKLSVSEFESGIYFVKINYNNKSLTQKIIVKK